MGDLREGQLVWQGDSPFATWLDKLTKWEGNRWIQREHPNRIYLVRWINPDAAKEITSLKLFSTNTHVLPILFGVTAETVVGAE
jgi:phage-related protein